MLFFIFQGIVDTCYSWNKCTKWTCFCCKLTQVTFTYTVQFFAWLWNPLKIPYLKYIFIYFMFSCPMIACCDMNMATCCVCVCVCPHLLPEWDTAPLQRGIWKGENKSLLLQDDVQPSTACWTLVTAESSDWYLHIVLCVPSYIISLCKFMNCEKCAMGWKRRVSSHYVSCSFHLVWHPWAKWNSFRILNAWPLCVG